jgi:multisubunit Na+/H+ antiporter MnhE subunit
MIEEKSDFEKYIYRFVFYGISFLFGIVWGYSSWVFMQGRYFPFLTVGYGVGAIVLFVMKEDSEEDKRLINAGRIFFCTLLAMMIISMVVARLLAGLK